MTLSRRERGQVLILLGAWLLFGGGAASALIVYDRPASATKKAIKRVIADADRRDAALSDIRQWESGQKKLDKRVRSARDELFTTLRRRDAQPSEAEPSLARIDAALLEMDRGFLEMRFRLKEHVTSAEWAEIGARAAQ